MVHEKNRVAFISVLAAIFLTGYKLGKRSIDMLLDRGELEKLIERSTQPYPSQQGNYYSESDRHSDHHDEHHDEHSSQGYDLYGRKKKKGLLGDLFDFQPFPAGTPWLKPGVNEEHSSFPLKPCSVIPAKGLPPRRRGREPLHATPFHALLTIFVIFAS